MGIQQGSSSSQTTSTQPYIISGPTLGAADAAAQAQINAAQQAAQAATQNTTSAINALMGEYGTALTYANPSINTGNQAAAQMNYMLGLPAVNPGAAPNAPTVNMNDIQGYLANNSNTVMEYNKDGLGTALDQYTGYVPSDVTIGNPNAQGQASVMSPGGNTGLLYNTPGNNQDGPGANYINPSLPAGYYSNQNSNPGNPVQSLSANTNVDAWATQAIQNDPSLSPQYQTALTQYQQQNAQYQQQLNTYNQYKAKGQATPADISDIVTNLPGFQFQQQQGIQGIQNAASANGMLNSGALLQQLDQFGQGLASTQYNQYLNQLGSLANMGQQATSAAEAGANSVGTTAAGLYSNLGTDLGNSALAQGQAMASSYLSPAANQTVNMFPYTTTSNTSGSSSGGGGTFGNLLSGASALKGLFSSKALKDEVNTPTKEEILENVKALRIDRWKYKGIEETHIGPYAEDFQEKFGVGDGKTINIIDALGVLFKSVQALSDKIDQMKRV